MFEQREKPEFGIKEFVRAFSYDAVVVSDTSKGLWVMIDDMPEGFMHNMKSFLDAEARKRDNGWRADNKTAFLWLGDDGFWHVMQFYDGRALHIEWSVSWGLRLPSNIVRGADLVRAAVESWNLGPAVGGPKVRSELEIRRRIAEVQMTLDGRGIDGSSVPIAVDAATIGALRWALGEEEPTQK